ncbi:MBL fold metallo-hydrolase [Candidatus Saccharibacteria bacterium]|nr:MBL fold metallo-hydrolase [Candidatus Saccharibacteria bacterium]
MRRRINKRPIFIFLLVFVALASFMFFIPKTANADSVIERLHFIKNESGTSDAIVIESDGHYGLVDTMNPGPNSDFASINTNQTDPLDNGTKVANYLRAIGCNKLDFIIITHNHSDHIGGLSELGDFFDDSHTIVFYKEDLTDGTDAENNDWNNHDYYEKMLTMIGNGDNNIAGHHAIACDVSKKCGLIEDGTLSANNSFISSLTVDANYGADTTKLKHNISFAFGTFDIKLYNIYNNTYYKENLNSIVTFIKQRNSGIKVALLGDIENARDDKDYGFNESKPNLTISPAGDCSNCREIGLAGQIAEAIGPVDILKASHHGDNTANSRYVLDEFSPRTFILNNAHDTHPTTGEACPREEAVAEILYLKQKGKSSYYTSQSDGAIVVFFTQYDYRIDNFSLASGGYVEAPDLIGDVIKPKNGPWYWMADKYWAQGEGASKKLWFYVQGNALTTNSWITSANNKYYFQNNGIMHTGWLIDDDKRYYLRQQDNEFKQGDKEGTALVSDWQAINNQWYYFDDEGAVATGLHKLPYTAEGISSDDYYYFNDIGHLQTGWQTVGSYTYYFRTTRDEITPGWGNAAVTGLVFIGSGIYYFRTAENDVTNGPEAAMVTGLVEIDRHLYYFRTEDNDIVSGPKGSAIKNKCVVIDGQGRCFGSDGAQTSTFTPIEKPTISKTDYEYTGKNIGPTISGYDSTKMIQSGDISATEVGEYSIKCSLKDKSTTRWSDGETADVEYRWRIVSSGPAYQIKNYTVNESGATISKIAANTSASTFKSNITLNTGISAEVDTHATTKYVHTGGKTRIKRGSTTLKEFTNIVPGDTDGNGTITYMDYVKVYNHIEKSKNSSSSKKMLAGAYKLAADMDDNDKINYMDYVKIYNKIKELKEGSN